MKKKKIDLTDEEIKATLDILYTAVSSMKGRQAVRLLLRDLLTESERIMIGRRLIIGRLLVAGASYDSIGERLGVGRATIGRVHRQLEDQFPGYENAIKEIEKEYSNRKDKFMNSSLLARLKKKYPLHFLLVPTK